MICASFSDMGVIFVYDQRLKKGCFLLLCHIPAVLRNLAFNFSFDFTSRAIDSPDISGSANAQIYLLFSSTSILYGDKPPLYRSPVYLFCLFCSCKTQLPLWLNNLEEKEKISHLFRLLIPDPVTQFPGRSACIFQFADSAFRDILPEKWYKVILILRICCFFTKSSDNSVFQPTVSYELANHSAISHIKILCFAGIE